MFLRDLQVTEVPKEQFETEAKRWLNQNRKTLAYKTTIRRSTSLRSFVYWARWGDMLSDWRGPKPGTPVPHPIPEGPAGLDRMIDVAASNQQRALIALCGFVGCRISEALAVRPEDFDLQAMTLKVHGKGERERTVPVSDKAWDILCLEVTKAFVRGGPVLLFSDRHGRTVITNLAKKAALKRHVSSHDLRATFATAVHDKTQDMRLVQELLGHANITQTQVYVGVEREKMRTAVNF